MFVLLAIGGCHLGGGLASERIESVVVDLSGTEGTAAVNVRVKWAEGGPCRKNLGEVQVDLDGTPIPFDRSWGLADRDCHDTGDWRLFSKVFPRGPGDRVVSLRRGGEVQTLTIPDPTGARHLAPVAEDTWSVSPGQVLAFDSPRADFRLEDRAAGTLAPRGGTRDGTRPLTVVASVSDGRVHARVPDVEAGEYMLSLRAVGRIEIPCFADACWAHVTAKAVHPLTVVR